MNLFHRLGAALFGDSHPVSNPSGWFIRAITGGKTKSGVEVNEYLALNLPAVWACINRISNPLAQFPLKMFQQSLGGNATEVKQHPLAERLPKRPNDYMSSRTLRKTAQGHALLWGNGYIEIERNQGGEAVGLWPLLPDRSRPVKQDGEVRFETTIDGTTFSLDHGNVIHLMDQSHDGYIGRSPVWHARQALGLALAMEEFGAKFFANDAKSGGFLLHPGQLSANARQNLGGKKEERSDAGAKLEKQSGLDNAHRVKVLEEGMKFVPTTVPPEEAQFLGSREFQIAEIARIYDVPLILLQSHEKSTSWGTGIEQLMIGFVRQTISPWVDAWEQELNWKLFTAAERERGLFVKFNMNAILRGDMAARAAFYDVLFRVGGFSPNQILALEEMEGIGAAGDEHFVPAGFVPISRALKPPEPPAPSPAPQQEQPA